MKKDLETFLYQIRITAEVHVQEMYDSDISAYTVEKTMDMEKRILMMRELHRLRETKLSLDITTAGHHSSVTEGVSSTRRPPNPDGISQRNKNLTMVEHEEGDGTTSTSEKETDDDEHDKMVHFTFSANNVLAKLAKKAAAAGVESSATAAVAVAASDGGGCHGDGNVETTEEQEFEGKLRRMHTAVQLNQAIRQQSATAQIVIVNFPAPPAKMTAEENYMEYLEALSEGLDRVLLVRGSGKEVVTMYS